MLQLKDMYLPSEFVLDSIASMNDLMQMKILVFAIWLAQQSGDEANPISLHDFFSYPEFIDHIGSTPNEKRQNVLAGIQANLKDGFFIGNSIQDIQQGSPFYLNTPRAIQSARIQGEVKKTFGSINQKTEQPDIFRLYEDNISPITPLIADALKDAEKEYPQHWLREAIQIAVANNVRKWRYIQAILQSWKEEGRDGRDQRNPEEDYKRYTQGKYGKFIKNK